MYRPWLRSSSSFILEISLRLRSSSNVLMCRSAPGAELAPWSDRSGVGAARLCDENCFMELVNRSRSIPIEFLFIIKNLGSNFKYNSFNLISIYKQPRPVSTLFKALIRCLVRIHYNPKAITKTECSTLILNKRESVLTLSIPHGIS